jgi:hypothetical protein
MSSFSLSLSLSLYTSFTQGGNKRNSISILFIWNSEIIISLQDTKLEIYWSDVDSMELIELYDRGEYRCLV